MILLPRAVRVYFASQPVNLRRSFDGLANEVRHVLGQDPLEGHVFVFLNRRRVHDRPQAARAGHVHVSRAGDVERDVRRDRRARTRDAARGHRRRARGNEAALGAAATHPRVGRAGTLI